MLKKKIEIIKLSMNDAKTFIKMLEDHQKANKALKKAFKKHEKRVKK
jgi:uncharacterized protein (DUF1778 family)